MDDQVDKEVPLNINHNSFTDMTTSTQQTSNLHDHAHAHAGLQQDLDILLQMMPDRRRLLRMMSLGAIAPVSLMACGSGSTDSTTSTGACSTIPSETPGPFPGDGTNGPNALVLSGIVRSNIKNSLTSSAVANGVPLTINLKLVNSGCTSLAGYAVYLWHADAAGRYSLYGNIASDSYLRGVQVADAGGNVSFATIFPACYDGRYPHVHFEVYPSLGQAVNGSNDVKTTQLTFTSSVFAAIYASGGYAGSAANLAKISLATDNVFDRGDTSLEIANTSGSVAGGYTASLQVAI